MVEVMNRHRVKKRPMTILLSDAPAEDDDAGERRSHRRRDQRRLPAELQVYEIAVPKRKRPEKEPPREQHLLKREAAMKETDLQKRHHE